MIQRKLLVAFVGALFAAGNLSAAVIPVSDGHVLKGLSPYNWVHGDGYISSTVNSASLALAFKGTRQVALRVDMQHMKAMGASHCPVIAWSVNGGRFEIHQLVPEEKSVLLSSGVPDPVIDFYVKGCSPYGDRYTGDVPGNSIKMTGFEIDDGGVTAAVPLPGKVWLNIGDSIMSGDGAAYAEKQGRPKEDLWAAAGDGRASYGYLLARHFGYLESRIAYGGYDWAGGMAHVPALRTLIDQKTSTVGRLDGDSLNPVPDVVLINLGENGVLADAVIIENLIKVRARSGRTAKLIVMIPVSGKGRTETTRAFNSYKSSSRDASAFLVDLGPMKFATCDGQHPVAVGHAAIYEAALPLLDAILGKEARAK